MKHIVRFLVVSVVLGSILAIAPPAMAARAIFTSTGGCLEGNDLEFSTTIITTPVTSSLKLQEIDVSNPCASAFVVSTFEAGSDLSTDIAVPSGVTAVVGEEQLKSADLWLLEVGAIGGPFTPGFGPCDYDPDFVVQPDGTLLPASAVCLRAFCKEQVVRLGGIQ